MAPSVPKKKRKVNLPENEEVAAWIFEKNGSIAAQQPGGLPEHQARALSAAYSGVCTAKEPIRTPGDLARLKGVGGWVVDVMKDSFPGSSLDSSPPRSNTPGETGKKRKRNKPYVPQLNSAAYAIVITLYREMIKGTEFMKKQELIDAAEASGLSRKAIGPNNYKSKHANSSNDFYTGWSCMKNLTDKDLVVKKSNPAKYYLTEKGKETARICLAKSGLDDPAGPLMATGHPESVMLSDTDSHEQEDSSPLIGSENFSERSGLPNSKAGNSSSFPTNNGRATNSPLSSRGMFGQQSFSAMGSAENSLLAMPPRQYDESFLDTYEVVLVLDDRDTFGLNTCLLEMLFGLLAIKNMTRSMFLISLLKGKTWMICLAQLKTTDTKIKN